MAPALSAIIVLVFFAMGSTMTFGQLINGGLPGILLGVICSVIFAIPVIAVDKLTGGTGVAGCGHFELRRSQCGHACCHGKRQRGHVRRRGARDGHGTGCCLRNRYGYFDPAGHQLVLQAF